MLKMKRSLSQEALQISTGTEETQDIKRSRLQFNEGNSAEDIVITFTDSQNQERATNGGENDNGGFHNGNNGGPDFDDDLNGFNHEAADLEISLDEGDEHINGLFEAQINGNIDACNKNDSEDINIAANTQGHVGEASSASDNASTEQQQNEEAEKLTQENDPADEEVAELTKDEESNVAEEQSHTDEIDNKFVDVNAGLDLSTDENEEGAGCSKSEGWDQRELAAWNVAGHNDVVTSVAMDAQTLVTASFDTTAIAWDLNTGKMLCRLGGHKQAVMSTCLLTGYESGKLLKALNEKKAKGKIVITASQDAYVKIWLIPEGRLLHSIYTFNNVWHVGYIHEEKVIITGTDAGKLEMFDAITSQNLSSMKAFELPIAALKVSGGLIFCGDTNALLQVWEVRNRKLNCKKTTNAVETSRSSLTGLALYDNNIVTGHITGSLKSTSMLSGVVKRHMCPGICKVKDVTICEDLLVAATSENTALHFYEIPSFKYLGSVQGEGKIVSVAAAKVGTGWRIVAGGSKVQVLETSEIFCFANHKESEAQPQLVGVTLWSQIDECETDSEEEAEPSPIPVTADTKESSWGCCVM